MEVTPQVRGELQREQDHLRRIISRPWSRRLFTRPLSVRGSQYHDFDRKFLRSRIRLRCKLQSGQLESAAFEHIMHWGSSTAGLAQLRKCDRLSSSSPWSWLAAAARHRRSAPYSSPDSKCSPRMVPDSGQLGTSQRPEGCVELLRSEVASPSTSSVSQSTALRLLSWSSSVAPAIFTNPKRSQQSG